MEVNGRQRQFEMYVPPTAPRPLPVVLLLHGGKGTAEQMRRYVDFDRLAAREGIIALYPQGLDGQWNDGRPELGSMNPKAAESDDTQFLLAIVDHLVEVGLADPKRVYAAGLANGGMMALRLACQDADRFAGVAVVAANQPTSLDCTPDRPVPILFFHGTDDRFVPFAGGDILKMYNIDRGKVLSATETVDMWRHIDGCDGAPRSRRLSSEHSHKPKEGRLPRSVTADIQTFEPCSGAAVEHVILEGGGHAWPGAKQGPGGDAILGPAGHNIDANEEIWTFFKAQPER